jgi:hypothetical protein
MLRALTVPAPLRLRPLEIGDLLDETFRMYRRHFLLFAGISVILSIPQAALAGYGYYSFFGTLMQEATTGVPVDLGQLQASLVTLLIGVLVLVVLSPFIYGAITYAVCESALGRPVTAGGIVSTVMHRYFQLLGYLLLLGLAWSILVCLFPLWIWISVGWVAVMPAMFVENAGLTGAMGRSWRLVEGRWWRTFFILFLMFIVYYFVSAALSAFVSLGQILLGIVAAQAVVLAVSAATAEIVRALVAPVLQIVIVLVYFDLRVRREGLDLFQLAQRVASPPPVT